LAAPEAYPAPAPEDGYRSLSVNAVLADLASLDSEQLLLVRSLEETGEGRAVILDRIDDLLVVQEATHHVLQAASWPATEDPAPAPPPPVPAAPIARTAPPPPAPSAPPAKAVSSDLVDQMGSLLARDDARRSPDLPFAPVLPGAYNTLPPPPPAGTAVAPNGHIAPRRRRMSHHGRVPKFLVVVIILGLLGAAGGVYWKQSHPKTTTTPTIAPPSPSPNDLASLMLAAIPGGQYIPDPGHAGPGTPSRPSDMAAALGVTGAAPVLPAPPGFIGGYFRDWTSTNGQQAVTMLIAHFQSVAQATASAEATVTLARTGATDVAKANSSVGNTSHESSFALPGIVEAAGFMDTGVVNRAQIVFSKGTYVVVLISPTNQADQIATAQYDRLPAN
jgi:hypothetical protein